MAGECFVIVKNGAVTIERRCLVGVASLINDVQAGNPAAAPRAILRHPGIMQIQIAAIVEQTTAHRCGVALY